MHAFRSALAALVLLAPASGLAQPQSPPLRPDQAEFRGIYKELVETNTSLSVGSCTEAAAKMGSRLKAAGFPDADLTYFADPAHPRDGGLVAVLHGADPKATSVLLLGHLDVVEANRADWTRDPFTLVEENGYFYGRGATDMKSLDAIWVDTLIRLKRAGKTPRGTLKMALTCGEETDGSFNGADWLAKNRPDLVRADFGLNEGGGGRLDDQGRRETLAVQVGEKAYQDYRLTVINPGGHSSRPRSDNAIYQLAEALLKVRSVVFPYRLNDTTRAALAVRAERPDLPGQALKRFLADANDMASARAAAADASVNAVLHTNCVATLLSAGHAPNALPQRATGNVNCRIFPGETIEATRQVLTKAIADSGVTVEATDPNKPLAVPPPLDPKVVGPMRALAAKHFPGVPLTPAMAAGASDAVYFGQIHMPIYGAPGLFGDPDGNGAHGLNERLRVRSLYDGRDYLFDLVKTYIGLS